MLDTELYMHAGHSTQYVFKAWGKYKKSQTLLTSFGIGVLTNEVDDACRFILSFYGNKHLCSTLDELRSVLASTKDKPV